MVEKIKYVVDNSKYVKINYEKINDLTSKLLDLKYHHWSNELDLLLNEEKWILLVFIIESMNFCFWKLPKWKIEYNNEVVSGSNALFLSVIREVERNPKFLNIDYLYNLSEEEFSLIFTSVSGMIPFIEERFKNFKETVSHIYRNPDFYEKLYSQRTDLELLSYITTNFKSFDDRSVYMNEVIYFNKRANLLVNDLFRISPRIHNNIKSVEHLLGCADYAVPRTFFDYGILNYDKELIGLIENEQEIPHNSEMEIEIRANMLYVIEIIKNELLDRGIKICSVELDNIIWNIGKINKKSKSHHTVTIYY